MRLVFSKDRAAQLDLLLRSIGKHMEDEDTVVLWNATSIPFRDGYLSLPHNLAEQWVPEREFNEDLRRLLDGCTDETVTFFCDDDIVYRDVPKTSEFLKDDRIITVCLYLGAGNRRMKIPDGFPIWEWLSLPRHDFGFPTAIDGNTYRVRDVLALIGSDHIPGPTMLETVMTLRAEGMASQRPLMTSCEEQCLVGVPVNRVSDQSGVRFGNVFPQTTTELNERFLSGERISLDLDFTGIESCHHEIMFRWETR